MRGCCKYGLGRRSPRGERGLKLINFEGLAWLFEVAPHAGSVD